MIPQLPAPSSQLPAPSSQLRYVRGGLLLAVILTCPEVVRAQGTTQVFTAFSTHDYNSRIAQATENDRLPAVWADVKTPGNGRTYSVGTVWVTTTEGTSEFSGVTPTPPDYGDNGELGPFPDGFTVTPGSRRQVVILQCTDFDQSIRWQNWWYGNSVATTAAAWARRLMNARAVSVWVGETESDTRVAICGETYDQVLQKNQFVESIVPVLTPSGFVNQLVGGWDLITYDVLNTSSQLSTWGLANGFVAVYDGEGTLLWSYQFFFEGVQGHCAITDLSVRVEDTPTGRRDVVTYCGISTFGVPTLDPAEPLAPIEPFPAPTPNTPFPFYLPAGGAEDNDDPQWDTNWDGIVGRLSNEHVDPDPLATEREFHSVVGGRQQDGLWGIAEMTPDRFVVVGGTAIREPGAPNVGTGVAGIPSFPFTDPGLDWGDEDTYCVGAVMTFDAGRVRTGTGPLDLELSAPLGRAGTKSNPENYPLLTHARDAAVILPRDPQAVAELLIVGTTNDERLFNQITGPIVPTTPYGPNPTSPQVKDGFVVRTDDFDWPLGAIGVLLPGTTGTYQGSQDGGYCGVAAFSEHPNHAYVVGRGDDISLTSYAVDTLATLRSDFLASVAEEEPAAMGLAHCTDSESGLVGNPKFEYYQGAPGVTPPDQGPGELGSPAGGGIAVDPRGRLNVVGSTDNVGYPVITDPLFPGVAGRQFFIQPNATTIETNGVRTVIDVLPPRVGRSDRTGEQTHNGVMIPAPLPGWTGGTTPTCALLPFGRRVGDAIPPGAVPLDRMLIDWEGPPPSPSPSNQGQQYSVHSLVIDSPPPGWQVLGTVIQWGVPILPTPGPGQLGLDIGGIENWVTQGVTHSFVTGNRVDLVLPPSIPGGVTYSAQVVPFLLNPLVPINPASCPVPVGPYAATPAIVFSYQ